jgi:hypothetical protein
MKYLNKFRIYEASNWWEEKLKDYELKHDYISIGCNLILSRINYFTNRPLSP